MRSQFVKVIYLLVTTLDDFSNYLKVACVGCISINSIMLLMTIICSMHGYRGRVRSCGQNNHRIVYMQCGRMPSNRVFCSPHLLGCNSMIILPVIICCTITSFKFILLFNKLILSSTYD